MNEGILLQDEKVDVTLQTSDGGSVELSVEEFSINLESGIGSAVSLFSSLNDTSIINPLNGQIAVYNSSTGNWENKDPQVIEDVEWGEITGTLSDQTDLQDALNLKTDETDFVAHTGDDTIHFTQAEISITESQISDLDKYTQAEIDAFLALKTDLTTFNAHANDTTIHFTESSIDHNNIQNKGTNTHAQIDTDLARLENTSGTNTGDQDLSPYELLANKSNDINLGASATLYPTQNAVKQYVDTIVNAAIRLQGDWNADTNTPDITGTTTTGFAWRVSVAGSTNLGGITSWAIGDLAVKTDSSWLKIDNEDVAAVWGNISGTLSNQTDLQNALDLKWNNDGSSAATGDWDIGSYNFTADQIFTNILNFDTSYTVTGSEPVGAGYWDEANKTYSFVLENGVIGQLFEEDLFPVQNDTGATLTNGKIGTYAGSIGNSGNIRVHLTVASKDEDPILNIGILTSDIADGSVGKVTTKGKVRGIPTDGSEYSETWTEGQILYKSGTVAGGLTNVMPQAPIPAIPFAVVISAHATNGTLYVRPTFPSSLTGLTDVDGTPLTKTGQILVWDNDREIFDFTYNILVDKEPTGFSDNSETIVSYDSTTRKITLTGTVEAHWQGKPIPELVSGWVSDAHPDLQGAWFLYYDGTNFVWSQTPWNFDLLQIAFVLKNNGDIFGLRECHGLMPSTTHKEFHETTGTYRSAGGDFSNYVLDSTTAADRRPDVSECTINDEDIATDVLALTNGEYTQEYLSSSDSNNFVKAATDIVPLSGSRPYWNEFSGSTWGQTLMTNNSYMSVWLFASPVTADAESQDYRFIWVQGQSNTAALLTQQSLSINDVNLGAFSGLSPEFVAITKVILKYSGANWTIEEVQNLTGTKFSQSASVGNYLSSVAVDGITVTGDGTTGNPLSASLRAVEIVATAQAEGNLNLSDAINWNVDKSQIANIITSSSSSDYLIELYADDTFTTALLSFDHLSGSEVLQLIYNYEDLDASKEVHIKYTDHNGTDTLDITIQGDERR